MMKNQKFFIFFVSYIYTCSYGMADTTLFTATYVEMIVYNVAIYVVVILFVNQ